MSKLRVMLIFGTRPEAIKMAPVVRECLARPDELETIVCLTGQHREMLQQVTDYFELKADIDLQLMRPNQTLAELTARCIQGLDETAAAVAAPLRRGPRRYDDRHGFIAGRLLPASAHGARRGRSADGRPAGPVARRTQSADHQPDCLAPLCTHTSGRRTTC